jgi:hypothetical protein
MTGRTTHSSLPVRSGGRAGYRSCSDRAGMLRLAVFVGLFAPLLGPLVAHAQNATWLLSPGSGDFDTPANWSSGAVPTGTATFGASNTTAITFSHLNTTVGTLQFNPGAPTYTFEVELFLNGTGIINHSSSSPTFSLINADLNFDNTSTAGNATITNKGLVGFFNTTTAGNAVINNAVINSFGGS